MEGEESQGEGDSWIPLDVTETLGNVLLRYQPIRLFLKQYNRIEYVCFYRFHLLFLIYFCKRGIYKIEFDLVLAGCGICATNISWYHLIIHFLGGIYLARTPNRVVGGSPTSSGRVKDGVGILWLLGRVAPLGDSAGPLGERAGPLGERGARSCASWAERRDIFFRCSIFSGQKSEWPSQMWSSSILTSWSFLSLCLARSVRRSSTWCRAQEAAKQSEPLLTFFLNSVKRLRCRLILFAV